VRVHVFPEAARFGRAIGRAAGLPVSKVSVHRFPDEENLIRVTAPAGRHAVLVHGLQRPGGKLLDVLLAADALRRAGARRVTLVAPYLPYMRQDQVFHAGEPVSQQVVGELLGSAFDGLITLEPHLHRTGHLSDVFPGRARALSAAPLIERWLARAGKRTLLVGPDAESEPWVRSVARRVGLPWIVGSKRRLGDARVEIEFDTPPLAKRAVLIDDIASTGITLATAARALRRCGIPCVDAAVVHALFAPGALARIARAGVRRIATSDSIPHPTNTLRAAPLFAAALGGTR
jgi:ribose-phosphate pyrophosphokinase